MTKVVNSIKIYISYIDIRTANLRNYNLDLTFGPNSQCVIETISSLNCIDFKQAIQDQKLRSPTHL